MARPDGTRIFLCYVPGLDRRRVDPARTPFVHDLVGTYPRAVIRTFPDPELLPSLLTGVLPHEHRIWQVALNDADPGHRSWYDRLPDALTTSIQCLHHLRRSTFDLPAIPPRRRRRFRQYRFKYGRREKRVDVLAEIGGYPTILTLAPQPTRYLFTKEFADLDELAGRLPSGDHHLEMLELYALDLTQHWNLDRPGMIDRAYRRVDDFVSRVHERCLELGVTMLLLVDHGQEAVRGTVDLRATLRKLGVGENEYTYYLHTASARFWFHTDRARRVITEALSALDRVNVFDYRDMHRFDIRFEDSAFGELYAILDPGYIYFPHDFYQPLANLFLALRHRHLRPRLRDPRHRGNHGYAPEHPSEKGWLVLAEDGARALRDEVGLIDLAPTVLSLLGVAAPPFMRGSPIFAR